MSYTHAYRAASRSIENIRPGNPLDPARGIVLGCILGFGMWVGILALLVG